MPSTGPILIIEDDHEDQEFLEEIFNSLQLKNEIKFFDRCKKALDFLRTTSVQPLVILSDVNLPEMNGFEMMEEICKDEMLKKKSIPFVFLTTSSDKYAIEKAYEMQVQGFFTKENSYEGIKTMIQKIVDYWLICKHPNEG